jgi:putative hydrolase of the HAD superfamily
MTAPLDPIVAAEAWIFDLDNTLYPARIDLFAQIDVKMRRFVEDLLGLSPDDARAVQKGLFHAYGTTMRGLMVEHGIEPHAFLAFVHDIDLAIVEHDHVLDRALGRLPGRKLVYTNGSVGHAERVMRKLGIDHHFGGIFDIVAADFVPKPDPAPYRTMLAAHNVRPETAVMVEDIARNLEPAAELGMTTVWIPGTADWSRRTPDSLVPPYVHHVVDDLAQWLDGLTARMPDHPHAARPA